MSTPAEAARLPVVKLRQFKNDPRRVHIVLRKPGSEPHSAKKDVLVVYEDYPRAVLANLTKYKEIPKLPEGYGELRPGVFLRMTATGTMEQGSKPPCPRVILNDFDYDGMKEVLEFNLRYCDGDKSGWPPLLCSGDLDSPKASKLLSTAVRLGTYTLHEASKEYLASAPSCSAKTRNMLMAAILTVPRIIEENSDPGALKLSGLTMGELQDVLKKEKVLPDDLDINRMSEAELADPFKRFSTLNVGDKHLEKTKEEMFIETDNFKKAQAASKDEDDNKKRKKATDDSEVVRKADAEKEVVTGKIVNDEERPKNKTSNLKSVQTSQVPNEAVSTKDDKEADSAIDSEIDSDVYSDIYSDGDSAADSDSSSDNYYQQRHDEMRLAARDYPFILIFVFVLILAYMIALAILALDLKVMLALDLN